MYDTQQVIAEWSRNTFPNQNNASLMAHLKEEVDELQSALRSQDDPRVVGDNVADCIILLLAIADLNRLNAQVEVDRKVAINTIREWEYDDEIGYARHVE